VGHPSTHGQTFYLRTLYKHFTGCRIAVLASGEVRDG
jgi:hypothetical protein